MDTVARIIIALLFLSLLMCFVDFKARVCVNKECNEYSTSIRIDNKQTKGE